MPRQPEAPTAWPEEAEIPEVITEDNANRLGGLIAKKPADRVNQGIFLTLYGQGGAGKTTLAADVYKLGKTALLDAESGTDAISHLGNEPNLDIYDIENYNQFIKAVDALPSAIDRIGYQFVVVDNLCEILDQCEDYKGIKGNDAHDLQNYKMVTREMIRRIKFLRALTRTRGITVILIAWDSDEKDNRGVLKKDLAFTPSLRKEFPGVCTIIGHVRPTANDPALRILDFSPSTKSVSKFKRAADSAAQGVPYRITYPVDNLPICDIIETIKGRRKWPEKKYNKKTDDD